MAFLRRFDSEVVGVAEAAAPGHEDEDFDVVGQPAASDADSLKKL